MTGAAGSHTAADMLAGPRCGRCRLTEAECARTYPCCIDCEHSFGEEPPPKIVLCTRCGSSYTVRSRVGRPPVHCPKPK